MSIRREHGGSRGREFVYIEREGRLHPSPCQEGNRLHPRPCRSHSCGRRAEKGTGCTRVHAKCASMEYHKLR
eukprot:5597789-Lingulodinium_polyedra.AAC.1